MTATFEALLENPEKTMTSIIKRVATGPELSKSISYDEARAGMRLVLDELADPVQAAVFLIGLTYGWRLGGITVSLYLLEGALGLPVFSGGKGGMIVFPFTPVTSLK